jgi:hypothetical protein
VTLRQADEGCHVGGVAIGEGVIVDVAGCAFVASGAKAVLSSWEGNAVEFVKHAPMGLLGRLPKGH